MTATLVLITYLAVQIAFIIWILWRKHKDIRRMKQLAKKIADEKWPHKEWYNGQANR